MHVYPVCDGVVAAAYPDEAVESVDGGELKAQTEEVKREDAENIHLTKEHSQTRFHLFAFEL